VASCWIFYINYTILHRSVASCWIFYINYTILHRSVASCWIFYINYTILHRSVAYCWIFYINYTILHRSVASCWIFYINYTILHGSTNNKFNSLLSVHFFIRSSSKSFLNNFLSGFSISPCHRLSAVRSHPPSPPPVPGPTSLSRTVYFSTMQKEDANYSETVTPNMYQTTPQRVTEDKCILYQGQKMLTLYRRSADRFI